MTEASPAENPIDLPTGEPIPVPTPAADLPASSSSSPSSSPKSPTSAAKALAAARLRGTDAFVTHLQRCLTTPGGIDTTLLFLCYTTRLSGALLSALARALLRRSVSSSASASPARDLVAFIFTTLPASSKTATAVLLAADSKAGAAVTPARAAAARLAALLGARLKSLGDLASETRTIARLWALLGMYSWARRLVLQLFSSSDETNTTTSKLATAVSWVQLLSCATFQYLENGAYLSGRGVLGWTPREQGRAYVVGARWLAVYTGLEIGKLLAEVVARRQQQQQSSAAAEKGSSGASEEAEAADKARAEVLRRSLAINLAWTPLTLHWATEGGFLSEAAVGLGGCIPGVIQMRKLWRETAL